MSLKLRVIGLNKFLTAIYRQDMRLSTMLTHLNFDAEQLQHIRDGHLERLINFYLGLVKAWILAGHDGERLYHILNHRFSFDGQPVATLENLGNNYGISRERVRQLEQKALRKCRSKAKLRAWETSVQAFIAGLVGAPRGEAWNAPAPAGPLQAPEMIDPTNQEARP